MSLRILKYIIQPVLLEEDEDGNVVAEHVGDAVAVFGSGKLAAFDEMLTKQVAEQSEASRRET